MMVDKKDIALLRRTEHPHIRGRTVRIHDKMSRDEPGSRSRAFRHGVSKSKRVKIKKPLLVIGTGRCGTTWLSQTLQAAGLDVAHECVGEHGSVSMFFQKDADWYPFIPWEAKQPGRVAHVGERRSDFNFRHVVHLVRHPLEVAASMQSIISELTMSWFEENGLLGDLRYNHRPSYIRNLHVWRNVVLNCEKQADQTIDINRFRKKDWDTMLEMAGFAPQQMPVLPIKNKSTGFKKVEEWSWDAVKEADPGLYKHLRILTKRIKPCLKTSM